MITIKQAKELLLKEYPDQDPVQWAEYKGGFIINSYPEVDEFHMFTLDPFFEITNTGEVLQFSPIHDIEWFDSAKWNSFSTNQE